MMVAVNGWSWRPVALPGIMNPTAAITAAPLQDAAAEKRPHRRQHRPAAPAVVVSEHQEADGHFVVAVERVQGAQAAHGHLGGAGSVAKSMMNFWTFASARCRRSGVQSRERWTRSQWKATLCIVVLLFVRVRGGQRDQRLPAHVVSGATGST